MEAGEENTGNGSLKRQRAPLSDSEDNVLPSSGMNDGQKRRRLEAAGQENRSPKPSTSGRIAELGMKPDTPIVPSVISRVQQLTQRREGAPQAQRCLSDPGALSPKAIIHEKGFRKNLLGEGEFSQRVERFKAAVLQAGPPPSPSNVCPRTRSNFVSDIHQKLQVDTTPSSKQVSRIRQEREQELSQLHFQPISENAWLKRSSSDPSLAQDEAEAEIKMKDGSFTEAPSSGPDNLLTDTTGKKECCDSEAPAAPVAGQLQTECKEQSAHQSEELKKEGDHKAMIENEEEQLGSQESQTVLKLSFSEDQKMASNEERLLHLSPADELNKTETGGVSSVPEQISADSFLSEEELIDDSSYNDEEIEPSTDEEFKLWRYPQDKVCEEEEPVISEEMQEEVCGVIKSSGQQEENTASVSHNDSECLGEVSSVITGSSGLQEDDKLRAEETQSTLNRDQVNMESFEPYKEETASGDPDVFIILQDQKDAEECTHKDHVCQQTVYEVEPMDLQSSNTDLKNKVKQLVLCPAVCVTETETQTAGTGLQRNTEDAEQPVGINANDTALGLTEAKVSECVVTEKIEQESVDERRGCLEEQSDVSHKAEEGGESLKKVTFILVPELINDSALSQTSTSAEHMAETSLSDAEMSSHDETNTNEIIDQMFEEVLEYAGRMEEERGGDEDAEDGDSGIGVCSGDKDKMDTESEKEKSEEEGEAREECDESKKLESNVDDLLTFPPSGILSPLSKSVEAVVTPLRLAASQESDPPSLLLTPEETLTPPAESAPLYSIDAYRTQRQSKLPTIQSVTPGPQRRAPEKSQPQSSVSTKERITALNEEAGKLQNVINQTLQALSCCTDEEHGRGSLEEAEAEKLLLVSCEKRSALLAEVSRLRAERNLETGAEEDGKHVSQQPCRGTVSITSIQLPLKVEFVCSSHSRTGRPSHYFFILIRYGPCNIIATPLATAADAQNGDTISFPTSVTLKDIRSTFEIDVEVYSLSHTSGGNCSTDRATTKSRVTPRKLLNTITRSSNTLAAAALPALNKRRSSNFSLVGSHKLSLASLGHSKFPLDKMKLEGKIRRLLGDEFQEKVPFLSPLEGNVYLCLDSQSHSNVQHQGFLTMFELISGYGVWHRRYFVLEGCSMNYWNHPNDKETKEAEGCIYLSSSPSQCVRPVKRDSCARPFTFELVSNIPHQQQDDSQEALAKCWFSADTKEERLDWMEKLGQALLDFHTWNRISATQTESQQSNTSSGNLRESIL